MSFIDEVSSVYKSDDDNINIIEQIITDTIYEMAKEILNTIKNNIKHCATTGKSLKIENGKKIIESKISFPSKLYISPVDIVVSEFGKAYLKKYSICYNHDEYSIYPLIPTYECQLKHVRYGSGIFHKTDDEKRKTSWTITQIGKRLFEKIKEFAIKDGISIEISYISVRFQLDSEKEEYSLKKYKIDSYTEPYWSSEIKNVDLELIYKFAF